MKKVHVIFERDQDGWWVASTPDVKGCHTQGRSIAQARQRFVEALGLFVDHASQVSLVEDIRLPADARRAVDASTEARAKADEVQRRAVDSTQRAVTKLTEELALSVRDVGELLGLSHQRVQQLASLRSPRATKKAPRERRRAVAR